MEEEKEEKHWEPTCPWEAACTAAAFVTPDLLHCLVTRLFILKPGAGWWTSQKQRERPSLAPTPSCYLISLASPPEWDQALVLLFFPVFFLTF